MTRLLVLLALLGPGPGALLPLAAQETEQPELRGRVVVGREETPLPSGTVVLHRIAPDSSGEVDSTRVRRDGSFVLKLPHPPDHARLSEVFLASIRYRDILYFGPALTQRAQLDTLYRIQVFDTVSAPPEGAPLAVSMRTVFVEHRSGAWRVTDLIQVENEGDRTLVAPADGVVWSYPLPPQASNFEAGESDLPPDAVGFAGDTVRVTAPVPPGQRMFIVRYTLPDPAFTLPLPGRTDRLEILVQEPAPPLELDGMVQQTPVEMSDGGTFRHYVGGPFEDSTLEAVVAPEPFRLPAPWLGVLLGLVLGVVGWMAYRRSGPGVAPEPGAVAAASRSDLILEIARLDEEFSRLDTPGPEDRRAYETRRALLLERLRQIS